MWYNGNNNRVINCINDNKNRVYVKYLKKKRVLKDMIMQQLAGIKIGCNNSMLMMLRKQNINLKFNEKIKINNVFFVNR